MFGAVVDYPALLGSILGGIAIIAVQFMRGKQRKTEQTQIDQQTLLSHYEQALREQIARTNQLERELNNARDDIRSLRNGYPKEK